MTLEQRFLYVKLGRLFYGRWAVLCSFRLINLHMTIMENGVNVLVLY